MTTLGTHNLLDGKAPATAFADILFFTEAINQAFGDLKVGRGYHIHTCKQQRDLVIAVDRRLEWNHLEPHYKRALLGVRRVSPNRGTFWLTDDVAMVALIVEHRINAAFPPFKRGEKLFRKLAWWSHTRMTVRIIKRLKKQGYTIYAGGDLNTPSNVAGYKRKLIEVGDGLDRLGSTEQLSSVRHLSRLGSDHPRLRAVAVP